MWLTLYDYEQKQALPCLMLLKQNKSENIKVSGYADEKKQQLT